MAVQERIRDFVVTNFYVSQPELLTDDASLLDLGVIDSTGVLEIIGFIESAFGVRVADSEMLPDNLGSLARIAAYVQRKLHEQRPPAGTEAA